MIRTLAILGIAALGFAGGSAHADETPLPGGSAAALVRLDYPAALRLSQKELAKFPGSPWLLYNEGCALAGLGRLNEAIPLLKEAEARFGDNVAGASVAAYRRAIGLAHAGMCREAKVEFSHYAMVVNATDPDGAHLAQTYAAACKLNSPLL